MILSAPRCLLFLVFLFLTVNAFSNPRWVKINTNTEWQLPVTESGKYKLLLQKKLVVDDGKNLEGKSKIIITGSKVDCDSLRVKLIFVKTYSNTEVVSLIDEQIYDDMWDRVKPRGTYHQKLIAKGVCLN